MSVREGGREGGEKLGGIWEEGGGYDGMRGMAMMGKRT
jgi:hypothetical protein